MCTPTIAIGALIGGGVGYAAGGKRGALLGALGGGFGGYALGGLGGTVAGAGVGFQSVLGPPMVMGSSFAGTAGAAVAGGGGFLSSLFSPQMSFATQLIGFGVQAMGMQQQMAFKRAEIAFRQALLRNQQIAAAQDNKALLDRLAVQKGILGKQGKQARGQLRVEAAGRGVMVDVGSEADRTRELAGQVAWQKLVFDQETALKIRDNNIRAAGFGTDSALLDFQLAESQRVGTFGLVGGALKGASELSSQFRWNESGQLKFRTRTR